MKVDYESFLGHLQEMEVVTLASDDPALKTEFLISLCNFCQGSERQVHFADLDLQFSSYLRNYGAIRGTSCILDGRVIRITRPSYEDVELQVIGLVSDKNIRRGGLIILDSLNSLQNEIKRGSSDSDSIRANHKASILITLVQQIARQYGKILLITNITRNRRITIGGEVSWDRALGGGRMITFKSDGIVMLEKPEFVAQGAEIVILKVRAKDSEDILDYFRGEL
ncbi:MAG: P-loop NTPase family protein [Nitrososphaerales archaeon]